MRLRLSHLIVLFALAGIACWIATRMRYDVFAVAGAWLGLNLLAPAFAIGLMLILLVGHEGPWWSFMITFGLVIFVSYSICGAFIGLFLTDEAGSRLFKFSLFFGGSFALVCSLSTYRARQKHAECRNWSRWIRVNLILALVASATFAVAWGLPWLYFQAGRRTVGVSVSRDQANDGLDVTIYGPAVNRRTLQLFFEKRISPGALERVEVLGFVFHRGFLPYDPETSPVVGSVRRMTFRRTKVGDGVISVLKQFSGLRFLDLRETSITAAGVEEIRTALPDCQIKH